MNTTFFLLILLSTTLPTITTTVSHPLPPQPPPTTDKDFIRTSCKTTLYPQTCFTSLSSFSYSIQQNPNRLARAAIGVTLATASHVAKHIANISRQADYSCAPRVAAAVHDCYSVFRDAVDEIRGSMRQMRRLGGSQGEVRFQLSNVQTWMSAALTNVETCTDGFDDVADDDGVKTDVCKRAGKVKEVTSNALALINGFASTIQTP